MTTRSPGTKPSPFRLSFARTTGAVLAILFLASGAFAQQPFVADQDTVALWSFDEGEGLKLRDAGPLANHLRFKAADGTKPEESQRPKWVRGKFGRALLFVAPFRQQFVGGKKPLGLSDAMTFEAWVKPEAVTDQGLFQNMQHSKNGFRVNLNDLKVQFCLQSGTHEAWLSSKKELPEGEWSHFACTYDGKMARIYVNGVLDVEMEFTGAVLQSLDHSITLGRTGGRPFFTGAIDSIRISRTARTDFHLN